MLDFTVIFAALFTLAAIALIALVGVSWVLTDGHKLRAQAAAILAEMKNFRPHN